MAFWPRPKTDTSFRQDSPAAQSFRLLFNLPDSSVESMSNRSTASASVRARREVSPKVSPPSHAPVSNLKSKIGWLPHNRFVYSAHWLGDKTMRSCVLPQTYPPQSPDNRWYSCCKNTTNLPEVISARWISNQSVISCFFLSIAWSSLGLRFWVFFHLIRAWLNSV
jgi:hypothetical protein